MERTVSGKIRIPNFQRPFVWKQDNIYELLDSVYQGFPIGSILVWETEREDIESAPSVGPIEVDRRPPGPVDYLLDGQQRVSTLVGTLWLPDESSSIINQVDWRLYFDLEEQNFVRATRRGVPAQYFPMAGLLDTAKFLSAARNIEYLGDEQKFLHRLNAADRLANAFRNYQLPLIRIRGADLDSAVAIFARLNRTGRKISVDEMVSALTYRPGEFHLGSKLDGFKNEIAKKGFGNLNRVFLLRAVLAALDLDIYAKDWAGLVVRPDVRSRLPDSFRSATNGINCALGFLKDLGVTSDRLLPYGLQLVLLGEFYRLCPQPTPKVVRLLRRWFWVTSFTGWFGAVSTSKATHALHEIRELANGTRSEFSVVNLDEQALPFPTSFDGRSARARAFLLYLVSLKPLSLKKKNRQKKLEPGKLLSTFGPSAIGYVSYNPSEGEVFSSIPANRMFMDGDSFSDILTHLAGLDEDFLEKLLPSHGFPKKSIQALKRNNKSEFILSRQENLINGEREFMEVRGVRLPERRFAETVADSDASDTDD